MALINMNKSFIKIPWNKCAVAYYILLLLNTFLYTLIFEEPRIVLHNFSQQEMALTIILVSIFNLFIFFLLMVFKWVFVIINPILYYIGAVGFIYADKFHLDTNIYSAPKFLLHNTISSSISSNLSYTILLLQCFY